LRDCLGERYYVLFVGHGSRTFMDCGLVSSPYHIRFLARSIFSREMTVGRGSGF
jgi:hypothetical protein